jgi:hypothetical protein
MTAASNKAASQSILAHEAGTGGKGNVAINAFGGRRGACHGCGSYNHHLAACPQARPDHYRDANKPRGRGQPQGDRGGCGRGGGSRDTGRGGGVGIKRTYLHTRGGGTRGAPTRRGFGNNSNRNGGVNGIEGEDEQYDEYYNELEGYDDTPSLNNVNGELDQEKLSRPPGQGPRQTETFATYIASLSEEDTAPANYCKYINCRLGQLSVPALLDSGNVWQNVMSKRLL